MPKLNASRIVNLTYNNKSENAANKIVDETFEMEGEHTLNLLRNGGGKTVQIQMLISPFVSPRFRSLGSRTFEDYFTDEKSPTYIATEWLLENGDKVLIGLAVKKSSSVIDDEDSKGLDIMSYVYEYKNENDEFSIRNMPFSKHTDRGYTVLSMTEAENLFKKLKTKNKFTFDYFNLSISSNRTRYYEKLRSYSIEPAEWESLMRTINQDEGGLSKLFENSKTESSLIENWFLKNINIKLNKDNEVIKEMGKSIKQYIHNKHGKQNLVDTLKGIEDYNGYAEKILDVNEKYKEAIDKKDKKEKEIEDVMVYNYQTLNNLNLELQDSQEVKDELDRRLAKSKYERESYEYHKASSEAENAQEKLIEETDELNNLKNQVETLERDEKIQDLINLNNQKEEKLKDLETVKAKRDKELQSNEEIQKQLTNVAYTLQALLESEKVSVEDKIASCIKKEEELNQEKYKSDNLLIDLKARQGTLEADIKRYEETILKSYNELLEKLKNKYDVPMFLDAEFINSLLSTVSLKLETKNQECVSKSDNIKKLNEEVQMKKDEINSKNIEVINLSNELKGFESELSKANKLCAEMEEVLEYLAIDDKSKIFDTQHMVFKASGIIKSVNDKIDYENNEKGKKMTQLDMLNKGVVVEVPLDVKNKLDELGIEYELGLNYLHNLKISDSQKEELLANNPYLPFAIMLEDTDIKLLEKTNLDIASSYNVYVVNKDKLNEKVNVEVSNSLYKIDNLTMLFNFNKALLDDAVRENAIDELEREISTLNRLINENREYLKSINRCYHKIENFELTESYIENLKSDIERLNSEINEIKLHIELLKKEQDEILTKVIPELREDLNGLEEERETLKLELYELNVFINAHNEFEKETKLNQDKNIEFNNNKEEISKIELHLKTIESNKNINEASLRKSKDILKDVKDKLDEIKDLSLDFSLANKLDLEKTKLEAQFKALKLKSSSSLEELEDRIKSLAREISRIEVDMDSIISLYKVFPNEYEVKVYLPEVKNEIIVNKNNKKKAIDEQQIVVNKATVALDRANDRVDKKLKSCNKASDEVKKVYLLTGAAIDFNEGILALSDIESINFVEVQEEIISEINMVVDEINLLETNISNIDSSNQMLGFLSYIREGIEDITTREVVLDIDNIDELCSLTTRLINEYKKRESEIDSTKKHIDEVFALLTTEFKYKDIAPFSKHIQSLLEVRYEPIAVRENVETTLELLDRLKKQNESDLKVVNEERENISKTLLKYVEETYNHLNMIDKNSRIDIDGENRKMLEIKQPDWDKVLYNTMINEFVDNITVNSEKRISLGEPIDEYIGTQVTTARLYDFVVGIQNVRINLRKLESLNNKIVTSKVKWKEIVKNSGGEGFVSAFVILVSLLSYMRKDSDAIGIKKEEGKVIIMDNPFGKMSSEHLIKPVMMIAEKYNAQLICYTAQKGDNIYNRFPNIYHMETEYIPGAKVNILVANRENEYKESRLDGTRFLVGEQQSMDDMFSIQ